MIKKIKILFPFVNITLLPFEIYNYFLILNYLTKINVLL